MVSCLTAGWLGLASGPSRRLQSACEWGQPVGEEAQKRGCLRAASDLFATKKALGLVWAFVRNEE